MTRTKIYFASDIHLGLKTPNGALVREKHFVNWLDSIKGDAKEIFLVGDIFDFWYEYKRVVPKGFTRFLGKVAEITDSGIPVHFFTGNHDVWMFDYFEKELGVTVNRNPIVRDFDGKKFIIGHGDGLGPGDTGYKFLKAMFTSKVLQWLFSRLHPNFSLWFGTGWSENSRFSKEISHKFRGEDEMITKYSRQILSKDHSDFFVFGHWHSPVIHKLSDKSNLILLGDWIVNNTFACWDGKNMSLSKYNHNGSLEIISIV
jgi:UDP-2,3-diacylglucosamine hydrolase